MNQQALIERVTAGMEHIPAIRALFLSGSYGRGSADAFSDVDLIALVETQRHAEVVAAWRKLLEDIAPIVFWNQRDGDNVLLNAISEDWLRCDLYIMPPAAFTARARDLVKPLIDRDGVYERLPATLPPRQPDTERVRYLINEFIRVLGLLKVALGREEYVLATTGAFLLRDLLTRLMLEQVTLPDPGGALHLSKLLPAEEMEMLASLPYPRPARAEIIEANLEIARQFFPRARSLAERLEVAWPEDFEAATLRNLRGCLDDERIAW